MKRRALTHDCAKPVLKKPKSSPTNPPTQPSVPTNTKPKNRTIPQLPEEVWNLIINYKYLNFCHLMFDSIGGKEYLTLEIKRGTHQYIKEEPKNMKRRALTHDCAKPVLKKPKSSPTNPPTQPSVPTNTKPKNRTIPQLPEEVWNLIINYKYLNFCHLMFDSIGGKEYLTLEIKRGTHQYIKEVILGSGVHINYENEDGWAPLICACRYNPAMVPFLIG
eukprot:TRINITY_DN5781_c0_g1_i1.p1 TRINITY_DN5781_c0_g1~~TRINITY_DN5781_c0_g1_i1.p1  ORF type:complete len:230 (-),score=0.84 TRINITY_DN5781_c0_g1_i1:363-1019(-)